METLNLVQVEHKFKVGQTCEYIEANITKDTLFVGEDGIPIGFYLRQAPANICKYMDYANTEFLGENVPKIEMQRPKMLGKDPITGKYLVDRTIKQFSTILGSIAKKPHLKRNYCSVSIVHKAPKAQNFIKAMLCGCLEIEKLIKEILPQQYEKQLALIEENVPKGFRFGNLFTSSISNYNGAAPYHIDKANIVGCVNAIYYKRKDSKGGDTTVPDYDATVLSADGALLVYPAWRNLHGVTPILPTAEDGYRNSLVFYPLAGLK